MKDKLIFRFVFLIFSIAILIFIFNMSSANADESTKVSGRFIEKMAEIFIDDFKNFEINHKILLVKSMQNLVRKLAHFSIFFALGYCVNGFVCTFNLTFLFRNLFSSVFCLFYAIFDEIHQTFVPGRSGQASDVLLDFTGSIFGILLMIVSFNIYIRIRRKLNEARTRQQET